MPSYVQHFCLPSHRDFVCLVVGLSLSYVWQFCLFSPWFYCCAVIGSRYNGLATLLLAAFGRVRALRARCGPFGPASVNIN